MKTFRTLALAASLLAVNATLALAAIASNSGSTPKDTPSDQIPYGDDYIEIDEPNIEGNQVDKAKAAEQFAPQFEGELEDDAAADVSAMAPAKPGDLNGDLFIDIDDLLIVINHWGPCQDEAAVPSVADIAPEGGNCMVDLDDMLIVLMNFGA